MGKRLLAGLLAACMLTLSGCGIGNTQIVLSEELSPKEVFRIGEETVTVAQMKVYLCNYQNLYDKIMILICGNRIFRQRICRIMSKT